MPLAAAGPSSSSSITSDPVRGRVPTIEVEITGCGEGAWAANLKYLNSKAGRKIFSRRRRQPTKTFSPCVSSLFENQQFEAIITMSSSCAEEENQQALTLPVECYAQSNGEVATFEREFSMPDLNSSEHSQGGAQRRVRRMNVIADINGKGSVKAYKGGRGKKKRASFDSDSDDSY